MAQQITKRGWDTFTDQPDPAVVSIVKEFYANVVDKEPSAIMVRGKLVSYSAASINEYYHLRPPTPCPYVQFLNSGSNYETMIAELCKPETTWTFKGPQGAAYFLSKDLSRYGKIWYAFLCAKLMPSQHVSDVTREKALLLYALVKDFSIDMGNVIVHSMRRYMRGNTQGGLQHLSLICGLCHNAGVRWRSDEAVQQPLLLLDHGLIARYKVWEGGESHPRGLGFIINPPSDHENDHESTDEKGDAPSSLTSRRMAQFSNQFRNLQLHTDTQHTSLARQNRRLAAR